MYTFLSPLRKSVQALILRQITDYTVATSLLHPR